MENACSKIHCDKINRMNKNALMIKIKVKFYLNRIPRPLILGLTRDPDLEFIEHVARSTFIL